MATRTIELPKHEWREACMRDADKCSELVEAMDMAREDGDDPSGWNVTKLLTIAHECLEFFNSGTAADGLRRGCKSTIRQHRELTAFVRKWTKLLNERKQWRHSGK